MVSIGRCFWLLLSLLLALGSFLSFLCFFFLFKQFMLSIGTDRVYVCLFSSSHSKTVTNAWNFQGNGMNIFRVKMVMSDKIKAKVFFCILFCVSYICVLKMLTLIDYLYTNSKKQTQEQKKNVHQRQMQHKRHKIIERMCEWARG